MQGKRVVLIDSDHGPMDYFVAAIKAKGIQVHHLDRCDQVAPFIKEGSSSGDVFIVDLVMLPWGVFSMQETSYGMRTGVLIMRMLREAFPKAKIMCFTNYNDPVAQRMLPEGVVVRYKYDFSPEGFVPEVQALLSE